MNHFKKLVVLGALATLSMPSMAATEADFGKIYTQCGLGGMVGSAVKDKSVSTVLAISTNITWDLGTTASISYFSSQDTCMNKKAQVAAFINQSYEKLENEVASGEGAYLNALTNLAKNETMDAQAYRAQLRAAYAKVVADPAFETMTRYEKVQKLYQVAV